MTNDDIGFKLGIAFGILAIAVILIIVLTSGSNNNEATKGAADYTVLRAELAKVEKGDFIGFKGQWYFVTATHFIAEGNDRNVIMLRMFDDMGSMPVYYNNDAIVAQISRVVRWEDPWKDPALTHALWNQAARTFLTR